MTLYIENPKESTKIIFLVINEFTKIAEYKTNHLCIHARVYVYEKHKNEIKKTILITIASQRIKY